MVISPRRHNPQDSEERLQMVAETFARALVRRYLRRFDRMRREKISLELSHRTRATVEDPSRNGEERR